MFLFIKEATRAAIQKVKFASLTATVSMLLLVACESAPVLELSEARQALSAARAAATVEFIPSLDRAEKLIFQAETALYGGDYRYAREAAQAAKIQALHAQKIITSRNHPDL